MLSPIVQYQPSREMDFAVLAMQETMREAWDIDYVLAQAHQTPSGLLSFFQNYPLFVQFHTNQIVNAGWFIPFMGATVFAFWVHPGHRKSSQGLNFLFEMLQGAFDAGIPAVIGWIQDRGDDATTRRFIRQHERIGYEYSGRMKKCIDGHDCHVVVITTEGFEQSTSSAKTRWLATRG